MSTVTIVTGLVDPSNIQSTTDLEVYLERFKVFADAGFQQVVGHVSPHLLKRCTELFPSVIFRPVVFEELQAYKIASSIPHGSPPNRNEAKDTDSYMIVINSKTELVARTISDEKLIATSHYAWIDFGIPKIFKDPQASFLSLRKQLETGTLADSLAIPGCWNHIPETEDLVKGICWRFCGGFFVGDRESILKFDSISRLALTAILEKYHTIVWEVNVWSYMNSVLGWRPKWYSALHDEGMFVLPVSMNT